MVGVVAAADKADAVLAELTAAGVVPETSGNAIKDMSGQAVKVRTPQVPPVSSQAQQPRAHRLTRHVVPLPGDHRVIATVCVRKEVEIAGRHASSSVKRWSCES